MSKQSDIDDDSFIIVLRSSPATVMDESNEGNNEQQQLVTSQLEDALEDLSEEANMAFRAQFSLGDNPSPSNMMVASTVVTDEKSTEDIQIQYAGLLDENMVLKETLKRNNDLMKKQLKLISNCQDSTLEAHNSQSEKFKEAMKCIEKFRKEIKYLKGEQSRLQAEALKVNSETGESKSTSIEFVNSHDDDTINKLTAQLELVERQRREVIADNAKLNRELEVARHTADVATQARDELQDKVIDVEMIADNEKLKHQLEAARHTVDVATSARDELQDKLNDVEIQFSTQNAEHWRKVKQLTAIIDDLNIKLESCSSKVSSEEVAKRDALVQQLESKNTELTNELKKALRKLLDLENIEKVSSVEVAKRDALVQHLESKNTELTNELKKALRKLLDLENIEMELAQYKFKTKETLNMYKDHIQELNTKIKEVQDTVLEPVHLLHTSENDPSSENATYTAHGKIYDRTLRHLSEHLNALTDGLSDSLCHSLGVIASLQDYKLERASVDRVTSGMNELRQMIDKLHATAVGNVGQVRGALAIFKEIFRDFNKVLMETASRKEKEGSPSQLSLALLTREKELTTLREELQNGELLRAQADSYRIDFEAERAAREKMASEKESLNVDLRIAQKKIQDLTKQLEKLRVSGVQKSLSSQRPTTPAAPTAAAASVSASRDSSTSTTNTTSGNTNTVYKCPKCMIFTSNKYNEMEEHFDFCLDDIF